MDGPTPKKSSLVGPELIARIARGDQGAFEELYGQSSTILFSLAVRILNNRDEASEVLQDVYLETWRKASNYDPSRGAPMAWLITLARSRALDRLRAQGSRGKGLTASLDEVPASSLESATGDVLELRAAAERQAMVGTAIKELPVVQRQAIELAFYEGLTHAEISERLQTPLGTIKTRIRLGMEKLRDSLQALWKAELGLE